MFMSMTIKSVLMLLQDNIWLIALILGGALFVYLFLQATFHALIRQDFERWEKMLKAQSDHFDSTLLYIKQVRQNARTGTKVIAADLPSGKVAGAWFPEKRVLPGNIVLVEGNWGYGPHHDEEVFYVKTFHDSVPKRVLKNWERHRSTYYNYCT